MKGNRIIKWMFALIVAAIIGFFGFVFKVKMCIRDREKAPDGGRQQGQALHQHAHRIEQPLSLIHIW